MIKDGELLKILVKYYNFKILRRRGSHIFLSDGKHYTTIPYHNRELGTGILIKILDDCEISKDDILKYM